MFVLLPCLNEEKSLPSLLAQLEQTHTAIGESLNLSALVVDDGSTDKTALIAQSWQGKMEVVLLRHEFNKGLGCALSTGITWFLNQCENKEGNWLAVMDADGTHPPSLLIEMVSQNADVVIASRYAPGGEEHGLTPLRKLYSRAASSVMHFAAGVNGARDYSCGYRVYSQNILERGKQKYDEKLVNETGFVCMAELLVKLGRLGAVVKEVPLKLHYELKGGESKMNVPATISRYVALVFNVLFNHNWR